MKVKGRRISGVGGERDYRMHGLERAMGGGRSKGWGGAGKTRGRGSRNPYFQKARVSHGH